jgi:hypothetical protein
VAQCASADVCPPGICVLSFARSDVSTQDFVRIFFSFLEFAWDGLLGGALGATVDFLHEYPSEEGCVQYGLVGWVDASKVDFGVVGNDETLNLWYDAGQEHGYCCEKSMYDLSMIVTIAVSIKDPSTLV